jgi:hypothetical protein
MYPLRRRLTLSLLLPLWLLFNPCQNGRCQPQRTAPAPLPQRSVVNRWSIAPTVYSPAVRITATGESTSPRERIGTWPISPIVYSPAVSHRGK